MPVYFSSFSMLKRVEAMEKFHHFNRRFSQSCDNYFPQILFALNVINALVYARWKHTAGLQIKAAPFALNTLVFANMVRGAAVRHHSRKTYFHSLKKRLKPRKNEVKTTTTRLLFCLDLIRLVSFVFVIQATKFIYDAYKNPNSEDVNTLFIDRVIIVASIEYVFELVITLRAQYFLSLLKQPEARLRRWFEDPDKLLLE